MRVLVDARELEERPTGVGRVVQGLVETWPASDDRLLLVARRPLRSALQHPAVEIVEAPSAQRLPGALWEQLILPATARRVQADCLVAPNYSMPALSPVPAAVCMHDCAPFAIPDDFSLRERVRRRWGARLAARRAAFLFTGSGFAAAEARRHLGIDSARLLQLSWGLTPGFAPPSAARVAQVAESLGIAGRPTILFLGSRLPRRAIDRLVHRASRLVERHPDLLLVIAGTNPRQLASDRAAPHVRALDYVAEEDLTALLAAVNVLAYPSTYEGFGLPVLEALACGTPVVASAASALVEVYGGRTDLVDHDDDAAWIAALDRRLHARDIAADANFQRSVQWARQQSWEPASLALRERLNEVVRSAS